MLSKALTSDEPIICINANKRLLNRDFEDVLNWSQQIHALKSIVISNYAESNTVDCVTFMTPLELTKADLPSKFHIVVDEFQLLLTKEIISIVSYFDKALSFVGVTGSPMPPTYRGLLEIL